MAYNGQCKGGPWDGQRYIHWAKSFPLLTPAITGKGLFVGGIAPKTIKAVEIGRYHFDDHEGWRWSPSHTSTHCESPK